MGRFDPKTVSKRVPQLQAQHAEVHNTSMTKPKTISHLVDSIGVVGSLSNRFREAVIAADLPVVSPSAYSCGMYTFADIAMRTGEQARMIQKNGL